MVQVIAKEIERMKEKILFEISEEELDVIDASFEARMSYEQAIAHMTLAIVHLKKVDHYKG